MSNLFQRVEREAFRAGITPRTKESREWFQRKLKNMRRVNRAELMKEDELKRTNTPLIGSMVMFFYDPKTKDTLPFYDKFPLTIIVGPAPGGFYGINLHYLPPTLRAKFLDELLGILSNKKYDESTRFRVSYNMMKRASKMKYFAPCFKHYLTDQVKGNFARVMPPEYEIAVFLPTADWSKASAQAVYANSRKVISAL